MTARPVKEDPTVPDAVLELDHVVKRFGEVTAVHELSLPIERGEFFSLLGPSGCGKTTTLRMLAGFETPDEGRILLEGADVTHTPPNRRHLNMVFQSYALFPHLDVASNVAYGLRREGVDRASIDERVTRILAQVELPRADYGSRRPKQLSGGQQQRVALARALVKEPKALLLDEPLGALDLKLRRGMQLELKSMQHELGITFVYVTHDQEEALTMSDRLAVMNQGRVVQLGTPRDIYERPRTRFVAGFIGTSNLLELGVDRSDGMHLTMALPADTAGAIRAVARASRPSWTAAAISLRPEAISLASEHDADACWLKGRVRGSVYLGSEVQHQVDVPGLGEVTVRESARQPSREAGAAVRLSWATDDAVVLDDVVETPTGAQVVGDGSADEEQLSAR